MRRRWWRRLAGFLVTSAVLYAAGYDYKAGFATADGAQALAVEDRRGARVVIVQAQFPITRAVADMVSAELMKAYGLERGGILLRGWGAVGASAEDLLTVSSAALGRLREARILATAGSLAVLDESGRCMAMLGQDGSFGAPGSICGGRTAVRGEIRAAFRTVDLQHGLQQRGEAIRLYPIQAISFGKEIAILALGGAAPAGAFASKGLLVAPFSNDDVPFPFEDAGVKTAITELLKRVGR